MDEILRELGVAAARLRVLIAAYEKMTCVSDMPAADLEIEAHLADAKRRLSLIEAHIASGEALVADGYPELPHREVPPEVMADLRRHLSGLALGLSEFNERLLTTKAELTVGPEIPV